ncbi:unnamed protein product [Tetraodon nigroviridis]|uniref:(spotted green pufferfish) hypothetical protein n=1 Tax=Tetraodon nigroviridis TaxID=99883 RepID=Q4S8P4_TETNG|nr:unnamed protein product [Tetraodon nigroviridis]
MLLRVWLLGLPDYGFYSAPSDQRGGPCSFADYGSLGPQAAQMLHSEHATSACNSPLQHLHSPDQFKNPGEIREPAAPCLTSSWLNSSINFRRRLFSEMASFFQSASHRYLWCIQWSQPVFIQLRVTGANPSRPGGFPGANSPGPVADLYAPSSQDSAVGNYISAASPQPGSGFGPSITVSTRPVDCDSFYKWIPLSRWPGCHLIRGIAFYLLCISSLYYIFITLCVVCPPGSKWR